MNAQLGARAALNMFGIKVAADENTFFGRDQRQAIMPQGVGLDDDPNRLQWKTPAGHTMHMPYRDETLERHFRRLGATDAQKHLQGAVERENMGTDERIAREQASWFNQNPRGRNALVGAGVGGVTGAIFGRPIMGAAAGASLGAFFGPTKIRRGPEHVHPDVGTDDVPEAFYHHSPEEQRHQLHMERMERHARNQDWNSRADRWDRIEYPRRYGRYGNLGHDPFMF